MAAIRVTVMLILAGSCMLGQTRGAGLHDGADTYAHNGDTIQIPYSTHRGTTSTGDTIRTVNKKRLTGLVVGSTVAYGITLYGLNELWYSQNSRESFHFFNDNAEWKQVDKVGHFYSTFYISYAADYALRWSGVKDRKAALIGSLVGFGVMLPIEIMDGYSTAYGASVGDLAANAAGAALYLGQTLVWKELRIYPKFSFHRTDYAPMRPDVLGDKLVSEMFKDYNGQTYWLSVDMDKFMRFPKWLNLAVGYGAEGMVYARDGQNIERGIGTPYRQYYVGIDFDLRAIRTRSRFLKGLIEVVSIVRLPAPAIQFSEKGVRAYAFYF